MATFTLAIVFHFCRVKLLDECKLAESGVQDGSTISLIMLPPFELYVQGTDQRMHTVVVPSSEPEVGAIGPETKFLVS